MHQKSKTIVMRFACCFLIIFLYPNLLISQTSPLPLNFNSYAIKLSVAKDESLVLTTKAGEIGLASSYRSDWRRSQPKFGEEYMRPTLEQANFFNKDTGFVSGFIHDKNGKYNLIYHTTNGGEKWTAINFGQDGWVDDAINLDNGEAWLSVSGSGIAYTKDYGFNWQKFKIPEIKQRFTSIFFNGKREGIIGSLWNSLAYTENNCATWKLLPTPLDQKIYNKTNKNSRPQFNRVAIAGDFILVKQEDLVFYSKRDSISWVWLKDYDDFYTDPDNTALYFKTSKGNIVRSDYDLKPVYTYENVVQGFDSKCRNGNLFIVSNQKIQKLIPDNQVLYALFSTNESSDIEPSVIGYTQNGTIGVLKDKAYAQKDYKGSWEHIFNFPFPVDRGKLSLIEYNMILYNRDDDSLFYFDLSGNPIVSRSKAKMIENFCKEGIRKLIFNSGSQGCFHGYKDELSYINENGTYVSKDEESSGSKHQNMLPENEDEIDGQLVSEFTKKVPLLFDKTNYASITDLDFTEKEYEQCRQDILDFKASFQSSKKKKKTKFSFDKNNIDFERLLAQVDSVKCINKEQLNFVLSDLSEMWSTTSFWKEVQLINDKDDVLFITSRYYEPNAFYFPWIIRLNGYVFLTTSIEVNKFLEKVYPSFLADGGRVEILHTLVKKLY